MGSAMSHLYIPCHASQPIFTIDKLSNTGKMQKPSFLPAKLYDSVGMLLGPYYRRKLFPSYARMPDRNNSTCITPIQCPEKIASGVRLQVVEYADENATPDTKTERRLFVYFHGRARSANRSINLRRDGSADTVHALLHLGTVLGVNLPGYEGSPLTDGKLKNAEKDTMVAACELVDLICEQAERRNICREQIIIVGVSIGMYMSLCLASELQQASVVLIVPPADLETVPFSVKGISLSPIVPWAARHAYPANEDVIEGYKTTGFNGVEFIRQHGERFLGNFHVFTAKDDSIVPRNAGERLHNALLESRVRSKHTGIADLCASGHGARPSKDEWCKLLQEWV